LLIPPLDRAVGACWSQHLVQLVERPAGAAPRRAELAEDALEPHSFGHQPGTGVEEALDLDARE
jgi:hypothetical protein